MSLDTEQAQKPIVYEGCAWGLAVMRMVICAMLLASVTTVAAGHKSDEQLPDDLTLWLH